MTHTTELDLYLARLTVALRLRYLDEDTIADAVAVVRSHVEETGADPAEAFGSVRSYADTFERPQGPVRGWGWYVVAWILAAVVASLMLVAAAALQGRMAPPLGIDPFVLLVVCAALLLIWVAVLLYLLFRSSARGGAVTPGRRSA